MSQLELEPLFERVLVIPDKVEDVTETGIVLPVESRKRPNTGKVVSVGHLVESKCPIKIGDHILYQRYSGLEVTHNGQAYHMIMANDILGRFTSETAMQGLEVNMPA
jgi:chaperonin GroES